MQCNRRGGIAWQIGCRPVPVGLLCRCTWWLYQGFWSCPWATAGLTEVMVISCPVSGEFSKAKAVRVASRGATNPVAERTLVLEFIFFVTVAIMATGVGACR